MSILSYEKFLESKSLGELALISSELSNDIDNELRENETYKGKDFVFPWLLSDRSNQVDYALEVDIVNELFGNSLENLINESDEQLQDAYADYVLENMVEVA